MFISFVYFSTALLVLLIYIHMAERERERDDLLSIILVAIYFSYLLYVF